MSFLGGPECSTGSNPLAQFQKQTSADTSLQRDRLTSRQGPQLNGFRTQQARPDDAAFQEFAHAGPQMGEALPSGAMHFEQMRREQELLNRSGGGGGSGWAGEFAQQPPPQFAPDEFAQQRSAGFNPQDFANFRTQQAQPRTSTPPFQQQSQFQRPMYGGGGGFGMQQPMMYQSRFMNQQPQGMMYEGKGKGKVQELSDTDWEQEFANLSTNEQDELDKDAQDAIERELNEADRPDGCFGSFDTILDGLKHEANIDRHLLNDEQFDHHFGDEYDQWKDFEGQFGDFKPQDWQRGPELGNYMFEENNVFKDVVDAFAEGQKIMQEGGNLSLAALAFEAAIQRDNNFVEAWVALGQAQAQNEKEAPAIRALEQALKLDRNNLDALMGLSVSYTNEGYDSLAYRTLERWVGAKYPSLGVKPRGLGEDDEDMGFTERHILHEKVTNLFLEAAQLNPEGQDVDVDVQVGLGVLFYGSEDYDKAVDCFTAALNSTQQGIMKKSGEEHLLWNRLGATLANSGRSEEAIEAYSRALELKSNFVRARYNLGVSCINLGVQEEAAVHLLGALSMHRVMEQEGRERAKEVLQDGSGRDVDDAMVEGLLQQNQSTNLYDTLRRVFTQMGRRDLSEMVGPDMDLGVFRREFDF